MEKEKCLNCGHIQEIKKENTYYDEMGKFTVCEECEGSYDIPNELEKIRQK